MKSFCIGIAASLIAFISYASGIDQQQSAPDTLIKLGQKKLLVNIVNIGNTYIYYHLNDTTSDRKQIERSKVQRILYHNGKKEVFNDPVVEMVNEDNWQTIMVTRDEGQVEGLYEIDEITAEASSGRRSIKAARKNAKIILQKKALRKGGNVVLITKAEAKGGFGDIPAYFMKGTVYSFQKPPESNKDNE